MRWFNTGQDNHRNMLIYPFTTGKYDYSKISKQSRLIHRSGSRDGDLSFGYFIQATDRGVGGKIKGLGRQQISKSNAVTSMTN